MAEEMIVKELDEVVVRFSGDSGDGMQLAGNMFSNISATEGNDISTFSGLSGRYSRPARFIDWCVWLSGTYWCRKGLYSWR